MFNVKNSVYRKVGTNEMHNMKSESFHSDPKPGCFNYFFGITDREMTQILLTIISETDIEDSSGIIYNIFSGIKASYSFEFTTSQWHKFRELVFDHFLKYSNRIQTSLEFSDIRVIKCEYGYEVRIDSPIDPEDNRGMGGLFLYSPEPDAPEDTPDENEDVDMVNSPPHYNHGGIETIELIEMYLSPEEFIGYLKGTVLKYRERAPYKGKMNEDYDKAYKYWSWILEKKDTELKKDRGVRKPHRTIDGYYECPNCATSLTHTNRHLSGEITIDRFRFCPNCGTEVTWEDI